MTMRKNRWLFLSAGIGILSIFSLSWAADMDKGKKDFEVYDLGEVVVSAEKPKVKEVSIINEVTAEDIKATNSHTVAEALVNAPGIRVTTGAKNSANVSIQGFSQNRVLVLIDGVPYYETNYGQLDLNQIPTENVAKIEITKGAASVLYGANALGGVINIITKKPGEKPYTSASAEFGENSTQRYSLTHGMKAGIVNYWLNYTYAKSNGWNLSNDYQTVPATITRRPGGTSQAILEDGGTRTKSDYESNNLWAKFGIEPNAGSAYYLNFHYLHKDKWWIPSTRMATVFNTRPYFTQFSDLPDYKDWGLDLDAKQKIMDRLTLKAKLFYHHHNDDLVSYADQTYKRILATSNYDDYIFGGSFFADFLAAQWDILRMSFHYKRDSHKQRDDTYLPFQESFSYTGSWGLENEFNLIKNLSVVAGVSYDWYSVNKAEKTNLDSNGNFLNMGSNPTPNTSEVDPMVGVNYTLADMTKLFGSIARKTRFPTLNELFGSKGGNPYLSSEKSWNTTLGVSRPIDKLGKAGLAFFRYDINDMIARDSSDPTAPNRNHANVVMNGLELNAEAYLFDGLTLQTDYMYNEARDQSPGRVTDTVTSVPKHKADFKIQYVIPYLKTKLNFIALYVGEVYSQLPTPSSPTQATLAAGDYTIFNFKVTQPFWKYFEAYAAVNNILDRNYEPEYGYPAQGRNFWVGIMMRY